LLNLNKNQHIYKYVKVTSIISLFVSRFAPVSRNSSSAKSAF